jgi:hypothetical protein
MALIFSTVSVAVTVQTSLTVTHGLGVAPTFTIITNRSSSASALVYVVNSNSQIIVLGSGGLAAGIANVDLTVVSAHSIIQ